mgnify:CR=1 FL=1
MEKLYKKLERYGQSDYYPFHMPGHKRNPDSVRGDFPFERDITEIEGFDNLHHPEDILLEAQQNVSKLYGTKESYYSVNGSTAALLAAVSAAVPRKGQILVARNCHKAVYHAMYLREVKFFLEELQETVVDKRRNFSGQSGKMSCGESRDQSSIDYFTDL